MQFSWLLCLAVFTAAAVIVYSIVPSKYRYIVLLVLSLSAYVMYSTYYTVFIVLTCLSVYGGALWIEKISDKNRAASKGLEKEERLKRKKTAKRKQAAVMFFAIALNLGILFVLKYFNFFSSGSQKLLGLINIDVSLPVLDVLMPLGISYYTLDAISYLTDVKNETISAEKNPLKVALFICFFPKLSEGPLGRYKELSPMLTSGKNIDITEMYSGLLTCAWGFFKVYVVAQRAAVFSSELFENYLSYKSFAVPLAAIMFTLQLYADFSGNIDIVYGISEIFGIKLARNFDLPFVSRDVSEFWRRWHISLGGWFRDYVYYPITLSQTAKKLRKKISPKLAEEIMTLLSLACVWFLTGLWHGAALKYVAYGLYYFVFIVLHRYLSPLLSKLWQKLKINETRLLHMLETAFTLVVVGVGMVLFRAENLAVFADMLKTLATGAAPLTELINKMDVKDTIVMLMGIALIVLSGVLKINSFDVRAKLMKLNHPLRFACIFFSALLILIFGAYGNGYLPPDPIYGGF